MSIYDSFARFIREHPSRVSVCIADTHNNKNFIKQSSVSVFIPFLRSRMFVPFLLVSFFIDSQCFSRLSVIFVESERDESASFYDCINQT